MTRSELEIEARAAARRRAWTGLALAVLAVVLLFLLRDVLLPFAAGFVLAYLLDPLADRLQRLGLGRLTASIVILATVVLAFALVLLVVAPFAAKQIATFAGSLPATASRLQQILAERFGALVQRFGGDAAMADLQGSLGDVAGQAGTWLVSFLKSLWSGGQAVIGLLSLLVVTPVVAFYLLVDWDRMVASVDGWVPPRHRPTVRQLAREIDGAIAGFIRGQSLVCLLLGGFYAIGLALIGLNFGILIGLMAGLLSFIPYVGSITGFLLATGVALVQFWPDWTWIVATVAVFMVGQFLEGNIISPKLVGESVGLHPVWLMFALLAFGSLFGFLGLLLAVPIAAAIGVVARFSLRRYLESATYRGGDALLIVPDRPVIVDRTDG